MDFFLPIDIEKVRKERNLDKLVGALEETLLLVHTPVQIRKYGALDEALLSESFLLLEDKSLQQEIKDRDNNRIYFCYVPITRDLVQGSFQDGRVRLTRSIFNQFFGIYKKIGSASDSFLEHALIMAKEIIELGGWEKAEKHSLYRKLSIFGHAGIEKGDSVIEGLQKIASLDDAVFKELIERFSDSPCPAISHHPTETVPLLFRNIPCIPTRDIENKTIIRPIYDIVGYAIYGLGDVKPDWLFREYNKEDSKKSTSKNVIKIGNTPLRHQDMNEQASEIIGLSAGFLHQCGKTQRFAYAVTGWPLDQIFNFYGSSPFSRHTSLSEDVLIYSFRDGIHLNL